MNRWIPLLLLGLPAIPAAGADTTIHPENAFAWSANAGWVGWRGDMTHGARIGEFVCSGYLYSANLGWIHIGSGSPANGIGYQNNSPSDFGVNRDPLGRLYGLAYSANAGWILFTNRTDAGAVFDGPRVDPITGRFSGSVFAANLGWINLSNVVAHVQTVSIVAGEDSDGDGMPDAWEITHGGDPTGLSPTDDPDGDGATNAEEHGADSDPRDPADRLVVFHLTPSPGDGSVEIVWSTRPTRIYQVQTRDGLAPGLPWEDSGLGSITPDGALTSRTLPIPAAIRFFRVEVRRPLAP